MEKIFFDNWESIIRTAIITVLAYCGLIFMLRTSGKRTLSKMNAFDFIITIALGSTLATVILSKDVALIDGLLAFALLILLQYLITFFSARFQSVSDLVKSTPTLLVYKGRLITAMMLKERIAEDEIYALVREKGFHAIEEIDAIILETDGTLTLIKQVPHLHNSVFEHVKKPNAI